MSSPPQSLKHRGGQKEKKSANGPTSSADDQLNSVVSSAKQAATSEWDFKLALLVITILAFATRFWGIGHPNQVVFDEVHFGKVSVRFGARGLIVSGFGIRQRDLQTDLHPLTLSCSLPHTTYNVPTSSMFILLLVSSCSP